MGELVMKLTLLAITSSLLAISMLVSACGKANEADKLKEIQENEDITVNGDHEYDKLLLHLMKL